MASSLFGTGTPVVSNQQTTLNDPQQIKNLLRQSSNPMVAMQTLANQGNTAAQAALSYLQNGVTPQQAVMGILQQRGIPLAMMLNNPLFR